MQKTTINGIEYTYAFNKETKVLTFHSPIKNIVELDKLPQITIWPDMPESEKPALVSVIQKLVGFLMLPQN